MKLYSPPLFQNTWLSALIDNIFDELTLWMTFSYHTNSYIVCITAGGAVPPQTAADADHLCFLLQTWGKRCPETQRRSRSSRCHILSDRRTSNNSKLWLSASWPWIRWNYSSCSATLYINCHRGRLYLLVREPLVCTNFYFLNDQITHSV